MRAICVHVNTGTRCTRLCCNLRPLLSCARPGCRVAGWSSVICCRHPLGFLGDVVSSSWCRGGASASIHGQHCRSCFSRHAASRRRPMRCVTNACMNAGGCARTWGQPTPAGSCHGVPAGDALCRQDQPAAPRAVSAPPRTGQGGWPCTHVLAVWMLQQACLPGRVSRPPWPAADGSPCACICRPHYTPVPNRGWEPGDLAIICCSATFWT